MVRIDLVDEQFGDLLKSLKLPENWREVIRRDMVAQALAARVTPETVEREKERLKLKKSRTIKLYKEGYIDEEEFQGEMAAAELALKQLDAPEVDGVTYGEVIEAGEHLPGMAALWDVATVEERYEMVTIVLEPGGLYYDLENKIIAALKPRPAFLPVLRMLNGIVEFDETRGLLVTDHWCERNRRVSAPLSPIFYLFLAPSGRLYQKVQRLLSEDEPAAGSTPPVVIKHRHPGPKHPAYGIPASEWLTVLHRVLEQRESLRTVAAAYGVSHETIRRLLRAAPKEHVEQEAHRSHLS